VKYQRAALAGAFMCSVVGCSGFWVYAEKAREADAEIDKTQDVRNNLEALYRACLDAETGQRGFLLTSRDYYLQPHVTGVLAARDRLATLWDLVPQHGSDLGRLGRDVEDKFDEMDETIRLIRHGDKPKAYTVVDSDRGKRSMERIRGTIDDLIGKVNRDLDVKRERVRLAVQTSVWIAMTGMALSAVLGGFSTLGTITVRGPVYSPPGPADHPPKDGQRPTPTPRPRPRRDGHGT